MKAPRIVEVMRRADQGATRPFVCRADDGKTYYVKGKSASTGERIREWMGSNLAMVFGLTVPAMALLEIPKPLIDYGSEEIKTDLGMGYAVGSQQILSAHELRHEEINLIPMTTQRLILLFDYWVGNEDRTLSSYGGNPNLLWRSTDKTVYAIDYNLVLQSNFDAGAFWATHAFAKTAELKKLNNTEQQYYQKRFRQALNLWPAFWQQLPDEWLDENESTAAFDTTVVLKQLQGGVDGTIWRKIR